MREEFRNIKGYPNYQVSNLGRVKVLNYLRMGVEKIRKVEKSIHGYLRIKLSVNGKKKTFFVHSLVITTFKPKPPSKECCNHINGVKTDNRIENLEWVSRSENTVHAYKVLGRKMGYGKGEKHPRAKLTEKQVIQIRALLKNTNMFLHEIGSLFKVTRKTICDIKHGRNWVGKVL